MRISQPQHRSRAASRTETVILFSVGGSTFAIAANAVDEIRDLAGLQEFHLGMPYHKLSKVKATLERQGKRYFAVDAAAHFRLPHAQPTRLLVLRHLPVAVIVDGIDRMQDIHTVHALHEAFLGEERRWYRGLTLLKGKVVPVVYPQAFLTKAETTLLNAALRSTETRTGIAVTA